MILKTFGNSMIQEEENPLRIPGHKI